MELYLHDNRTDETGKHGPMGPTHCATIRDIDYDYQLEQWVIDTEKDDLQVVRMVASNGREWTRGEDGKFHEVTKAQVTHDSTATPMGMK